MGPGAVKSGVGTAILLELARTFSAMVKKGKTHLDTSVSVDSFILTKVVLGVFQVLVPGAVCCSSAGMQEILGVLEQLNGLRFLN